MDNKDKIIELLRQELSTMKACFSETVARLEACFSEKCSSFASMLGRKISSFRGGVNSDSRT
jgi:hypothetical protein